MVKVFKFSYEEIKEVDECFNNILNMDERVFISTFSKLTPIEIVQYLRDRSNILLGCPVPDKFKKITPKEASDLSYEYFSDKCLNTLVDSLLERMQKKGLHRKDRTMITEERKNKIAVEVWIAVKKTFGGSATSLPKLNSITQPDPVLMEREEIESIRILLNNETTVVKIYNNHSVCGSVYIKERDKDRIVIILDPYNRLLERRRLVFELQSNPTIEIPIEEENVIKQETGLPFDLEQLCNHVGNVCGSIYSLKSTNKAIEQSEEVTQTLVEQKVRYGMEVVGDIVSNWNTAVEFRFSPDFPTEATFLHFPESSLVIDRHVVTAVINCKLKYVYKTESKTEHYLLSVVIADQVYNAGIPVDAIDYITILSAFGGRVEINTLIKHLLK